MAINRPPRATERATDRGMRGGSRGSRSALRNASAEGRQEPMLEPPDDLPPEPGWTPLAPLGFRHEDRSFVRSDGSEDRLRVRYFRREGDQVLLGKIWFG